jgi:hypothetical protein
MPGYFCAAPQTFMRCVASDFDERVGIPQAPQHEDQRAVPGVPRQGRRQLDTCPREIVDLSVVV